MGKKQVREVAMDLLWLLVGSSDAVGWDALQVDSKEENIDLVIFDRDEWALIRSEKAPSQYEGLVPKKPSDGMYVSEHGFPVFIVNQQEVRTPEEVIRAVGGKAEELFKDLGDPLLALERAGYAF